MQRDKLLLDCATTDVILKMKRFPLLFSPCCPCYAEIGPCYFFRGISLETLMESAFVDDFVVFWRKFCDSPLYFAPVTRHRQQPSARVSDDGDRAGLNQSSAPDLEQAL